jgi:thioredoxin 1
MKSRLLIVFGVALCCGSRAPWGIWLLAAGGLYAITWWAESVKKKEGTFRMLGKLGKLAVVVALIASAGVVIAMKKTPSPGSATQPAVEAGLIRTSEGLPRLLDLGFTSCIPCKMMAPILEQLKQEQAGKVQVDFIDVWQDKQAGERYQVNLIPTQIFCDGSGKELFRHEGFMSKEDILSKCRELGFQLAEGATAAQPMPTEESKNG